MSIGEVASKDEMLEMSGIFYALVGRISSEWRGEIFVGGCV